MALMGIVFLLPALLLAGCVSITADGKNSDGMSEENQKNTFTVSDSPTIDVTGFNGSIEIAAGPDGEVDVEATLRLPSRISYSAKVDGNKVTVDAEKIGSVFTIGRSPEASIRIVAPEHSTIIAHTSNGPIIVDDFTGGGVLKTSNGRISLTDVEGEFTADTSNGSVVMEDVSGQFDIETSNGKIIFSGEFVDGSDNVFRTSNGSIVVEFSGEPSVELDARTNNGSVENERPILTTTTEKSRLVGKYGEGLASLELRTSNGSIDIR
jgi:DUF4097 and DUF4098 domain-containing protein YvlB